MPQLSRRTEGRLLRTINGETKKQQPKPGSMTHQFLLSAFPGEEAEVEEEREPRNRRALLSPVRSLKKEFKNPSPLPSSNGEDTTPTAEVFNPPPMASSDDELSSPGPSRGRNADMKTTMFATRTKPNERQPSSPMKLPTNKRRNALGQTASPGTDVLTSDIPTRDSSLSDLSEDDNNSKLPSPKKKRTVTVQYGKKGTKVRTQAKPAFKAPAYDSSQSPRKEQRPGLVLPPGSSPPRPKSPLPTQSPERRATRPTKAQKKLVFNSSDESDPEIRAAMKLEQKLKPKGKRTMKRKLETSNEDSDSKEVKEPAAKPEFKAFGSFDEDFPVHTKSSSPIKVPIEDLSDMSDIEDPPKPDREESDAELYQGPVCPWCGDVVSETLLQKFTKGKRMNVGMQTKFCRIHKRDAARTLWKEKEYPKIEWDTLPGRLSRHHDYILEIIDGKPTHHRTLLAEKIESGYGRKLREDENLSPGYYGPRGFNIMCDYLTSEFGELLKEKAITDRVIAGRGTVAFIQVVLVADLAVVLIKEDMEVNERKAVGILEESKALGDMLCEDV